MTKPVSIRANVIRVLKSAGLYRPELTYQIEMLVNDLIIYRKLSAQADGVEEVTVTEYSREGTPRLRPHPIFAMVQAQANQLRQDLKVLLMNYDKTDNKAGQQQEDDTLAELMTSIRSIKEKKVEHGEK